MTRRLLSLLVVVAVLCSGMAVTAYAAESNDSGWVELLETISIQDNGENIFRMGQTYTLSIPTPKEMRLRKIDMLIRTPAPHPITAASCTVNTTTMELTVLQIGDNLVRIVGTLPDATYEVIKIKLSRSGTSSQPYEVLSCKVTPLAVQEFVCDANVYWYNPNWDDTKFNTGELIEFDGTTYPDHGASTEQFRVTITDWRKYDSISIWGSADGMSIDSVRASLYTSGLPITVNYFQYNDAGSWTEFTFETDPYHDYALEGGASISTPFYGKYLFNIIIDLENTDRSLADPIHVYFTGHYDTAYGCTINCQYVNGSVVTADTTNVTWWQKFTSFMTGLFGGDSQEAEDFQDDAAQKGDDMAALNEQLQEATKPPIGDIQVDIDSYIDASASQSYTGALSALTSSSLLISMMSITLTIALLGYILYGKR